MSSEPTVSVHRRPDIQGLRAFAVVVVVAFHSGLPLPGGFVGVDVFFVISGFVIAGMLLRERDVTGAIRLRTFYARRFRRLTPALALVVTVTVIASFVVFSPTGTQQVIGLTGIGAMTLIANGIIARMSGGYFDPPAASNPLLNTWSLSVEEQFYLVFPALLIVGWWLGRRFGRPGRVVLWSVGLVTVGSLVVALVPSVLRAVEIPDSMLGYYSPVPRVWEFGAGALLALLAERAARVGARLAGIAGVVGLLLLMVSLFVVHESAAYPDPATLIPVAGTLLILLAGMRHNWLVTRGLSWRPFVRVGDWSYSIYLWHWPVIVFAAALWPNSSTALLVAAALSLLPALAAFRWVEQPLRRATWGPKRTDFVGQAVVLVLVPVFASAALWLSAERANALADGGSAAGLAGEDLVARGLVKTIGRGSDCLLVDRDYVAGDIDRCTFPVPGAARGWILLAGDSHADALSDGVVAAGHALGYDVVALTGAGCEFSRSSPPTKSVSNCAEMANAVLDRVKQDPPAAVFMTQRASVWLLDPTLQELESAGVPVIYVRDNPAFGTPDDIPLAQPCAPTLLGVDCEITRDEALRFSNGTRSAETALLARHPSLAVIDSWETLCDADSCSALIDGRIAYWDYNHLNAVGSRAFTDQFVSALRRVTGSPALA